MLLLKEGILKFISKSIVYVVCPNNLKIIIYQQYRTNLIFSYPIRTNVKPSERRNPCFLKTFPQLINIMCFLKNYWVTGIIFKYWLVSLASRAFLNNKKNNKLKLKCNLLIINYSSLLNWIIDIILRGIKFLM